MKIYWETFHVILLSDYFIANIMTLNIIRPSWPHTSHMWPQCRNVFTVLGSPERRPGAACRYQIWTVFTNWRPLWRQTSAPFDQFIRVLRRLCSGSTSTGISRSKCRALSPLVGPCVYSHCHLLSASETPASQNCRYDPSFDIRHQILDILGQTALPHINNWV